MILTKIPIIPDEDGFSYAHRSLAEAHKLALENGYLPKSYNVKVSKIGQTETHWELQVTLNPKDEES